jgi:hypothetical protein
MRSSGDISPMRANPGILEELTEAIEECAAMKDHGA